MVLDPARIKRFTPTFRKTNSCSQQNARSVVARSVGADLPRQFLSLVKT